ncbi:hypothetical protein DCO48_06090 [Pseudomonas sp. SDI]|uniref:hypothetical protein n=1 Tax=Pseudomonas sp. SDI TaxID=2170734 RepID=UPI000DE64FF9|nr:hypothetical protein [Pseudomonas sp. SDI]PWB34708.1 hypothetical protein DCO48_06090 [Pseudomonas sp. SDI]
MTFFSKSLEDMISSIYADGDVSIPEYQNLRDDADLRMERLITEFGQHNNITAFQKSMDVSMQLLQLSVLQVKKDNLSPTGEAIVADALAAQVEYFKSGARLALKALVK